MILPKADIYVVAVSGGKDSAALAVLTAKEGLDCYYIFNDTKAEYPEVYDYLTKIEQTLGINIIRLDSEGFEAMLKRKNYFMPSPHHRWCTVELKIKPMVRWIKQFDGQSVCVLTGNRADDRRMYPARNGKDFIRAIPLVDLGYGKTDVNRILIERGIGVPVR